MVCVRGVTGPSEERKKEGNFPGTFPSATGHNFVRGVIPKIATKQHQCLFLTNILFIILLIIKDVMKYFQLSRMRDNTTL